MERGDFSDFVEVLEAARQTLGGKEMTDAGYDMFFGLLLPYSLQEIRRAILSHLQSSSFMPRPADLIKLIEGTPEERASLAWAKVVAALTDHGTYKSLQFDDPYIHYAVKRMGGWILLGQTNEDQARFIAKDFERYYTEAQRRHLSWESPEIPPVLPGLTDADNIKRNAELSAPVKPHEIQPVAELPQIAGPAPKLVPLTQEQLAELKAFTCGGVA